MVTTNSDTMAEIARSFKDHGYREEERKNLLELEALYTYIHHQMGYNYRMTEMQAAIGLKALEKLDWNLERRRENAHYLSAALAEYPQLVPPFESEDVLHAFYKYYVRIKPEKLSVDRDTLVKALRAEGVPVGLGTAGECQLEEAFGKQVGYGSTACPFQCPWYKGRVDYSGVELPAAKRLSTEAFVLQVHPTIEREDLDDVIKALDKVLNAYGK
jgi:hypothetical protein